MIIDDKSYVNIASTSFVKNFWKIIKYHISCRFRWLNKYGKIEVNK